MPLRPEMSDPSKTCRQRRASCWTSMSPRVRETVTVSLDTVLNARMCGRWSPSLAMHMLSTDHG